MGIYGALATAVSGLQAQAFALENISGNIANSQTTAFKRTDTDFVDMIAEAAVRRQTSGAVQAYSVATNDERGDIIASSSETHMALNNKSFFVVDEKVGTNDGQALFGGTNYYSRRGDFQVDADGYMVNGAGYFLKGLPIDSTTGNISGSVPEVIKIDNSFLPAKQTTTIDYKLNLPQVPQTPSYDEAVANSDLLNVASYAADPTTAGTGVISATDSDTFLSQSISGGAITVYSASGAPVNVQMRWAKVENPVTGTADRWNMFYLTDSTATGAATKWQNSGQQYSFAADGSLSPAVNVATMNAVSVNGVSLGNLDLQHQSGGVTQFDDANGTAQVTQLAQDGFAAGEFVSVTINNNGRIVATYSNGESVERAQIVTADFNASNQLKKLDGGTYAATSESGEAIFDNDGGGIQGASLEASNTDISEEFTRLIVTQQAYAAGTRIVTTSDEMLQEALNMVR
ncbi:MAG TPA: flagellar hook-basal body complex protein [Devosia sp.]|nr:flagellar hook-basal body complex protein [Devosia sp.]